MQSYLIRYYVRIAIECKASSTPVLSKGFLNALDAVNATECWVIALVKEKYPIEKNVIIESLFDFIAHYKKNMIK